MRDGDICEYRKTDTGELDHTRSRDEQAHDDDDAGLVAFVLSLVTFACIPLGWWATNRGNARLAEAQRRTARPQRPPPANVMDSAYAAQVARAARQPAPLLAQPPPPPPPAPPTPPTAGERPAPTLHHEL